MDKKVTNDTELESLVEYVDYGESRSHRVARRLSETRANNSIKMDTQTGLTTISIRQHIPSSLLGRKSTPAVVSRRTSMERTM